MRLPRHYFTRTFSLSSCAVKALRFPSCRMVQIWCNFAAHMSPTVSPYIRETRLMATIVQRTSKAGQTTYRAQVRRKGTPPLSATFPKLSEARKWVQTTEAALIEGRHFKTAEAKRRTLADLIDRYMVDILPNKGHRLSGSKPNSSCGGALI